MGRESTKHSPRLDDQLKHETDSLTHGAPVEARSREDRLQETPIEGEPVLDLTRRPDIEAAPGLGISPEAAEARAEVARAVVGARFPATRDELIAAAEDAFASDAVRERLRGLPCDGAFENVQAVWAATGGEVEDHHAI